MTHEEIDPITEQVRSCILFLQDLEMKLNALLTETPVEIKKEA